MRTKRVRHSLSLTLSLFLLSRQVSNLNSSDPESDVLPITPRDSFAGANINILWNNKKVLRKPQDFNVSQYYLVYCVIYIKLWPV